ncbi:MAG TPA: SyrP protein [Verrucomicrobiales bacterium]|nr:SyrP protein [Verrucomicrobiales bacterium]
MSSSTTDFDVSVTSLPGRLKHGATVFPYSFHCNTADAKVDDARKWLSEDREELLKMATTHGAVLFRDFPAKDVEVFDTMIQAFSLPNFPYRKSLSNAVRVNQTERVFSANEAPSEVRILLHHEMAQTPMYPRWILFYCGTSAQTGGATPICRSDVLYERLVVECPDFIRDCETKGLQYTNIMPDENDPESGLGRSWRSTLGVEDRDGAENRLRDLNYSWQWLEDECLKVTTPQLPAVMEVSPGRKTFFNQLIAAFGGWKDSRNDPTKAIRHGDGTELHRDSVQLAIKIADELSFDVQWKDGDFALIDNTVAMHARRPFTGTRKVYASLASMQKQSF